LKKEVFCPGKINLFLEVLDKRPNGYHNLSTLFQAISYGDTLSASPSSSLSLKGGEGLTDHPEDNLIIKAALKIKEKYHISQGILFEIQKNLPVGAGLGGGSSNAAGAIRLCNEIWKLNKPLDDYMEIATQLGADVPFFLKGGTQFASGIGEILEKAPSPHPFSVLIATPHCFVNTSEAYRLLPPYQKNLSYDFKADYQKNHPLLKFSQNLKNDFEAPVLTQFPQIKRLWDSILTFNPEKVMLSGSGASLFALFNHTAEATRCQEAITDQCRFQTVCQFLPAKNHPKD